MLGVPTLPSFVPVPVHQATSPRCLAVATSPPLFGSVVPGCWFYETHGEWQDKPPSLTG